MKTMHIVIRRGLRLGNGEVISRYVDTLLRRVLVVQFPDVAACLLFLASNGLIQAS